MTTEEINNMLSSFIHEGYMVVLRNVQGACACECTKTEVIDNEQHFTLIQHIAANPVTAIAGAYKQKENITT